MFMFNFISFCHYLWSHIILSHSHQPPFTHATPTSNELTPSDTLQLSSGFSKIGKSVTALELGILDDTWEPVSQYKSRESNPDHMVWESRA